MSTEIELSPAEALERLRAGGDPGEVALGRERSEWIASAHIAEARVNEIKETF